MSEAQAAEAPSLRAVQEAFWSLLRAPTGVRDQLAAGSAEAWLVEAVVGCARASATERLDIYANMYFYRLLDALTQEFPTLAKMLGEGAFHNLVTDYVAACPSEGPSLRHLGRRLPAFVRDQVSSAWLAELAAVEWARADVFDRPDDLVLTMSDLSAHAQQGFGTLQLWLIEAHALVPVTYAVEDLWRQLRGAEPLSEQPEISPSPGTILVWRQPDGFVYHRRLEAEELGYLEPLTSSTSFLDFCSVLGAELGDEQAAARAMSLLAAWTSAGLLRANLTISR